MVLYHLTTESSKMIIDVITMYQDARFFSSIVLPLIELRIGEILRSWTSTCLYKSFK